MARKIKLTLFQEAIIQDILEDIDLFYSYDKELARYIDEDNSWIISFNKTEMRSLMALKRKIL